MHGKGGETMANNMPVAEVKKWLWNEIRRLQEQADYERGFEMRMKRKWERGELNEKEYQEAIWGSAAELHEKNINVLRSILAFIPDSCSEKGVIM